MTEDLATKLNNVAVLAEPARHDLYRYVAGQAEPVSREQASAATGMPHHAVKFHLDRLVEAGLLDVEYRRLTGRTGPGAGRPAKLYRRATRDLSVSVPERRYELAAWILADAVRDTARGVPLRTAVDRAADAAGRRAGARVREQATEGGTVSATVALAGCGYEPRPAGDRTLLSNCPFHALATEHTDMVCGMNLAFVRALVDEAGVTGVDAVLDPAPGRCCVALAPPAAA